MRKVGIPTLRREELEIYFEFMSLPKFLQSYLPSYNLSQMDLNNPDDKREIITQILNYGDKRDIIWLFKTYNQSEIKKNILKPLRGYWQEKPLNYWLKISNLKIPKILYQVALFSLNPRPKLMRKYFRSKKSKQN